MTSSAKNAVSVSQTAALVAEKSMGVARDIEVLRASGDVMSGPSRDFASQLSHGEPCMYQGDDDGRRV